MHPKARTDASPVPGQDARQPSSNGGRAARVNLKEVNTVIAVEHRAPAQALTRAHAAPRLRAHPDVDPAGEGRAPWVWIAPAAAHIAGGASPASVVLATTLAALVASPGAASGQEQWKTDFDKAVVPWHEIVSGGPPKDGIPALDAPTFTSVAEADRWLDDREPVAVVRSDGVVKAYPLQILIWHEIVNDVVGGDPISVTFCPLCNTTLAFDRRFDGRVLDFGTTGRLRHSDLVMYDRQTETWWQQATGEGIIGRYSGEKLTFVPAPVLRWADVKEQAPEAEVLSRDTGHDRDYGRNPYEGYDRRDGPFARFFKAGRDDRLPAMERIVALQDEGTSLAVPFRLLEKRRVVHVPFAGRDVAVFWAPGTASALDAGAIARGRDVGASAVFEANLEGRALSFEAAGDGRFRDRETGSIWNLSGHAVSGRLAGSMLQPVPHGNHFWFAWVAFKPDTEVRRK